MESIKANLEHPLRSQKLQNAQPSRIKNISAFIAAGVLAFCQNFCDAEPPETTTDENIQPTPTIDAGQPDSCKLKPKSIDPNLLNSEYAKLIESLPNFQFVLDSIKHTGTKINECEFKTYYEYLLEVLNNGYNPETSANPEYAQNIKNKLGLTPPMSTYLFNLANALWIEKNKIVPWSLAKYTPDEIRHLTSVRENDFVESSATYNIPELKQAGIEHSPDSYVDSAKMHQFEEEMALRLHPLTKKMIKDNQHDTIVNAIRWVKSNFFHFNNEYPTQSYQDKEMGLETILQERAAGCHGPAAMVAYMMRSLNIPATNYSIKGHGVTYMPSYGWYVHGDLMVIYNLGPADNVFFTISDVIAAENADDKMFAATYFDKSCQECFCHNLMRKNQLLGIEIGTENGNEIVTTITTSGSDPTWTPACMGQYNTEAPQYHLTSVQNQDGTYTTTSTPVKIKSYYELVDPNTDIWE